MYTFKSYNYPIFWSKYSKLLIVDLTYAHISSNLKSVDTAHWYSVFVFNEVHIVDGHLLAK